MKPWSRWGLCPRLPEATRPLSVPATAILVHCDPLPFGRARCARVHCRWPCRLHTSAPVVGSKSRKGSGSVRASPRLIRARLRAWQVSPTESNQIGMVVRRARPHPTPSSQRPLPTAHTQTLVTSFRWHVCAQVVRGNSIVMMEALEKLWSEVPKPSDFGGR